MKKLATAAMAMAVLAALSIGNTLQAQPALGGSFNADAATVQLAPQDSIIQLTAEAAGLALVPPAEVPFFGTFWVVEPGAGGCMAAPLPCPPLDPTLPIYAIADGQFLVDGTGGQAALNISGSGLQTTRSTVTAVLASQADAVMNLIGQIQASKFNPDMALAFGLGETTDGPRTFSSMFADYDTNALWLEITNVSSGRAHLNLRNATNQIYAIWSTTNLSASWQVECELWPTDTNCMPFTVPTLNRQNLFLRAQDWTGVDDNGNGIPDWWEWKYFGDLSLSATNDYDGDGVNNGDEYTNRTDPNTIAFTVRLGNQNFNTTNATGSFLVLGGVPRYAAAMVNGTNNFEPVWEPYDGNLTLKLGPTDGVYQVQFGLKGLAADSQATWMGTEVTLDRSTPQLFITNPTTNLVGQTYLQIQGYARKPLAHVTFDLSNAAGSVANQSGFITGSVLDPNALAYTTNFFQCYDLRLAAGSNAITLHATDPAGNTFTTNLNISLAYSAASNPVVQLAWPPNGIQLCGGSFTLRGWTEDAAATIAAQISDTNGNVSIVAGMVERDGKLWVENLPLTSGTNVVTLWVTNSAGLSSETNLYVVKSDMTLAVTSISGDLWLPTVAVSGTISDVSAAVWVNGIAGTNNGDGTWSADQVPAAVGGIASFDVTTTSSSAYNSAISFNTNKPDELKLESGIWRQAGMSDAGSLHSTHTQSWTAQTGGQAHDEFHPGDVNWNASDATIAPDGSVTLTHYTDNNGADYYTTNSGMASMPWSVGALSGSNYLQLPNGSNLLWSTFKNSAKVEVVYLTGGPARLGDQSLYEVFSGVATEQASGRDIPPQQITVTDFGETLAADRTAYKVLPNPPKVRETLQAAGPWRDINQLGARYRPISQTVYPALTNTNRSRTTLGVAEEVNLFFKPTPWFVFDWTNTAGGLSANIADSVKFTAPSNAAPSVIVTATIRGGKSLKFPAFTVVEPIGIDHAHIIGTNNFPLTTAGACMTNAVWIAPTYVSFYRVNVLEVGEDATNLYGFFADTNYFTTNPAHELHHNTADHWTHLNQDNRLDDLCSLGAYLPWAAGGFEWKIPRRWQVEGSGLTNPMTSYNQVFSIDSNGTARIDKYGNWVQRTTNNVITIHQ